MDAALPDDKARESLFDRDHYAIYVNGVLREADVQMQDKLGFGIGAVVRPASKSSTPLYALVARLAHPEKFNVPMLVITGWYDNGLARHLETFEALRTKAGERTRVNTKLVIGERDAVDARGAGAGGTLRAIPAITPPSVLPPAHHEAWRQ